MKVVTCGAPYLDIDAYAGIVAYAELLQAQGIEAVGVSTAPWNESISRTVRSWNAPMLTDYAPLKDDTFTLVDISDPAFVDTFVDPERVDSVIDHHVGFEQYWQDRIGEAAHIEFIGAACTLVYEHWQKAGLFEKMSIASARLMICGILDNTLNFGAQVTTPRDVKAYKALLTKADLPDDWTAQYFTECQEVIVSDISSAIENDTKVLSFGSFAQPVGVGQLVVWDGHQILTQDQAKIRDTLAGISPNWFLNLISVGERKSYFVAEDPEVQSWLTKVLDVQFDGSVAAADRLWLRKEIIKADRDA
jgi:nanoRNase/pAp phosphatase (c-di-AMP/oligoRNAs hydrolase)